MNSSRTVPQTLFLILQILITLIYSAMMVHMTLILYSEQPDNIFHLVIPYLPYFILLVSSLGPQFALRIRKKLHSQDGEIFPLLFTIVALQVSIIIPQYTEITGIFILEPHALQVLERFSLLGTAALFLLSSLRYAGFSSSRMSWYVICFLGFSLFICMLVPTNSTSNGTNIYEIYTSKYDAYIHLSIILIYIATIATFLVAMVKDKNGTSIKRLIGFTLIITGIYLSSAFSLIPVIISCVLYIAGIIIISINTKESF